MLKKIDSCSLLQDFNWSPVHTHYLDLCQQAKTGQLQASTTYLGPYTYSTYELAKGILTYYDGLVSTGWYQWVGAGLEDHVSVCADIKNRIDSAALNFVNFNYYEISSSIKPHIDQKMPGEADKGHCNLNYVTASSDADCYAYVDTSEGRQQMLMSEKQCYLIDTTVRHGVVNNAPRSVFQIKFHSPAELVLEWLEDNPNFLSV